jgi:hypothetical protein
MRYFTPRRELRVAARAAVLAWRDFRSPKNQSFGSGNGNRVTTRYTEYFLGRCSLIAEQGCADFADGRDCRQHRCLAAPRRIAPSIPPDLISGRDSGRIDRKSCAMTALAYVWTGVLRVYRSKLLSRLADVKVRFLRMAASPDLGLSKMKSSLGDLISQKAHTSPFLRSLKSGVSPHYGQRRYLTRGTNCRKDFHFGQA